MLWSTSPYIIVFRNKYWSLEGFGKLLFHIAGNIHDVNVLVDNSSSGEDRWPDEENWTVLASEKLGSVLRVMHFCNFTCLYVH